MYIKILVPLDGSARAGGILPHDEHMAYQPESKPGPETIG